MANTWTDSTTGGTWSQPIYSSPGYPPSFPTTDVTIRYVEGEKPERRNVRYLFRITIVNPKTGGIVLSSSSQSESPSLIDLVQSLHVIAKDRAEALLKADIPANVRANADDYDFLIEQVGEVRPKRETQKVKVVKDEEVNNV